jgi:hypothetical protein
VALLEDSREHRIFEASDIAVKNRYVHLIFFFLIPDNIPLGSPFSTFYVVFDSLDALGRFKPFTVAKDEDNMLIGPNGGISQYEGISWITSKGTFLLARENSISDGVKSFYTDILEVAVAPDHSRYDILEECFLDYQFDSDNKGIESIRHFEINGDAFMLALCEGNNCLSGKKGNIPGNGRILLTKYVPSGQFHGDESNFPSSQPSKCSWQVIKQIVIPPEVQFIDYAGLGYWNPNKSNKFAFGVLSQENSAIWMGEMNTGYILSHASLLLIYSHVLLHFFRHLGVHTWHRKDVSFSQRLSMLH